MSSGQTHRRRRTDEEIDSLERDRFAGCLVGQALGDALGFIVEGCPPTECEAYVEAALRPRRLLGYSPRPLPDRPVFRPPRCARRCPSGPAPSIPFSPKLDLVRGQCPTPWLHIAEEVAAVAVARRFARLALLGTRYLMEGPVYPTKLSGAGIPYEIPDAQDRARINAVIFDELVYGRFEETSRDYFQAVIRGLGARGCDAVVLGCTEIPLLVSETDSLLPALDSTRILARAALREAQA